MKEKKYTYELYRLHAEGVREYVDGDGYSVEDALTARVALTSREARELARRLDVIAARV